jgi:HEAT repeat protein
MKCEEVDKMMIDYLDLNLGDDTRKEIEKHIETCERCIDELKDTQSVMNLISKDEMEKPDDSLRINFYHMLHSEIKRSEERKSASFSIPATPWYSQSKYRVAAAVALLVFGTFIGMFVNTLSTRSVAINEIKQLQTEVTDLKKDAMFTMLKEESSSDRIQAVTYAGDLDQADENVINVLVETLNNDKNVSVRMAAAYALSKFANKKEVTDFLVKSLSMQTEPILQVTLINILAERKEKSAVGTVQKIIANKNTLKEVRAVAENSLRLLI